MNQQNFSEIKEQELQNEFVDQKQLVKQKNSGSKFDRLKFLKNLRIQQDMRRLKSCLQSGKQLKNESQRILLEEQIKKYEQFIKLKKKEFIQQKISLVEERKKQRQEMNNLANKRLLQVKKQNKSRRNKLESIVKQYKQQQQLNYQKAINQRKIYRVPINIQEINQHQKVYFHQKLQHQKLSSQNTQNLKIPRLKTSNQFGEANPSKPSTNASRRVKQQLEQSKNINQQKRKKIAALIFKRNQYGTKVEQLYHNNKVAQQKIIRAKTQFSTRNQDYEDGPDAKWHNMMQTNNMKKIMKKPKLQTNNSIVDWRQGSSFQIHNLQNNYELEDIEKVQRLNILQEKFKYYQKIKSGNPQANEALQLRTQVNIAKANLLLKHNF